MTHFFDRYYPTVSLRRGEMRAFEKLQDSEKEKTLPIVLLAPWLNSISFDNSFKIIQKSMGNIPIVVDLDRYYRSANNLESRAYFWSLLEPIYGPEKWMQLVQSHQNFIPCFIIIATGFCIHFYYPFFDTRFGTIFPKCWIICFSTLMGF